MSSVPFIRTGNHFIAVAHIVEAHYVPANPNFKGEDHDEPRPTQPRLVITTTEHQGTGERHPDGSGCSDLSHRTISLSGQAADDVLAWLDIQSDTVDGYAETFREFVWAAKDGPAPK